MRHGRSSSSYPPRSGYDELDTTLMPPRPGEQFPGAGGTNAAGESKNGKKSLRRICSFTLFFLDFGMDCFCIPVLFDFLLGPPVARYSSLDDPSQYPSSLQGSINYDQNNSVFEDNVSISQAGHPPYGAPKAIFDEDEAAQNEPPPLMKKASRSTLGSESRGCYACFSFLLLHMIASEISYSR